ncbi:hypothetical protein [Pseudomonas sp. EA_5y_Pfl2_R50]
MRGRNVIKEREVTVKSDWIGCAALCGWWLAGQAAASGMTRALDNAAK